MQRRRSRFTIYTEGRQPAVMLCYSAEFARSYYERLGYTVTRVVAGDYRKQARQQTAVANAQGFRVDQAALKDACELLNIKLPVKIRTHSRVGGTLGNHRFRSAGRYHDIMLKSYRTAQEASETLWHELTHAMQAERAMASGLDWNVVSLEQRKRYPYRVRPIEIEARNMATTMRDIPLCK